MNAKRLHYALIGLLVLSLVVLCGAVYMANNFLVAQSKRIVDAQVKNLTVDEEQRSITKAKADIEKYRDLAAIAKSIVPQDKDQAQTVREIVNIADQYGIKLGTISFPSSTLGATKPGTKVVGNPALSQLAVVKGISGVYSLNVTVDSDASSPASYAKFIAFLDALEHNRRTALVNGITLQPNGTDPSKLTFSLLLNEYIKP
ncbi:MAG TPA: hypothetical protein VLE73_03395 [Candidatus Saccharimonadales bacterium]|nr:hypothetical protein [Candidatus Saccharimonadales bacterium]